jgi:serine/threonine-protein kinase
MTMPAQPLLGTAIGAYQLTAFLGEGGMGAVYRGAHRQSGQVVAVKVLHARWAETQMAKRFANEAQIQAALHHPHIARLYDTLEFNGRPALVMEYVDGETLEARLNRTLRLAVPEALRLFRDVADALGYLHARGIVHRDVKPHNIKVDARGTVKVLDFGIAKGAETQRLTRTGAIIGTPDYLAPEQVRGQPADARSDVWALGVLLYEMVTGRAPFAASDMLDLFKLIDEGHYVPPAHLVADLDPDVEALIDRCLQKRPGRRYRDARTLTQAVDRCLSRYAPPSVPSGPKPRVLQVGLEKTTSNHGSWGRALWADPRRRLYALGGMAGSILLLSAVLIWLTWIPCAKPFGCGSSDPEFPQKESTVVSDTPASPGEMRTITIDVIGKAAEVYQDGERVGQTPYRVEAPLGEHVELLLRRDGVEKALRFDVTPNTSVYTEVLDSPRPD